VTDAKIQDVTAAKITTGTLNATETITSEGVIRAVDDINTPTVQTGIGPIPLTVNGSSVTALMWSFNDDGVTFAVDELGNVSLAGNITGSSGTFGDVADEDFVTLDEDGIIIGRNAKLKGADAFGNDGFYFHEIRHREEDWTFTTSSTPVGTLFAEVSAGKLSIGSTGSAGGTARGETSFDTQTIKKLSFSSRLVVKFYSTSSYSDDGELSIKWPRFVSASFPNQVSAVFTDGGCQLVGSTGAVSSSANIDLSDVTVELEIASGEINLYIDGVLKNTVFSSHSGLVNTNQGPDFEAEMPTGGGAAGGATWAVGELFIYNE